MADFCTTSEEGALRQGEILSDLSSLHVGVGARFSDLETSQPEVYKTPHPFVIVVSQDCDLDQDYRARVESGDVTRPVEGHPKCLNGIFLLEVFGAEEVYGRDDIHPGIWKQIQKNTHARWHFFETVPPEKDTCQEGLPELTIDFKRYFTVEPTLLYAQLAEGLCRRRCRIIPPYSEHFYHRLFHYLSRVGLPEQLTSEPLN